MVSPMLIGPMKHRANMAKEVLRYMPDNKMWYTGGYRSAAVAAELLRNGKIIALPTDTIYGLAGPSQNDDAIARLYEIKKRDANKPLAICVWNVNDIKNWAHVQHLPNGLLQALLPGPTTLVLKRKSILNPSLNPGVENVGIRVPDFDFVRTVVRMLNQPIALTSANVSNQQSTLHPEEFKDLWPELDGVFYDDTNSKNLKRLSRKGSTVIDLTNEGHFKILREGMGYRNTLTILEEYKLQLLNEKNDTDKIVISEQEESELSNVKAENCASG